MSSQRKIRVAVVCGGRSTEHAVSCLGAGHVLAAIDRDRYEVVPIGIAPDGRWVLTSDDPARLAIQGGELPTVDAVATPAPTPERPVVRQSDAPMCMQCGVQMQRAGSCFACPSCGTTSGCS